MIGAGRRVRLALIGLPFGWLALFFLAPLLIVLAISLAQSADAIPPYLPLITLSDGHWRLDATVENFVRLLREGCLRAYLDSVGNAGLATLLCLLIGYPMAYAIARAGGVRRQLMLFFVILPFWTSFLIRVYAWMAILQPSGLLNQGLLRLGVISEPVPLLYNGFSLELGLVYSYLPFMILPIYGSLSQLDPALVEAASDLGARPARVFLEIVLPLSLPGVGAGVLLVFIPAIGEYVIPDLLGGPNTVMIGKVLWAEFFDNRDWPAAAAIAIALVAALAVPVLLAQRLLGRERPA